jgi:hypothetical protein
MYSDNTNLSSTINELELCGKGLSAWEVLIESIKTAGRDNCVYLHSEASICNQFCEEVEAVISKNNKSVIQFFSKHKDDLQLGTRWVRSNTLWMGVCYYMPGKVSVSLLEYLTENLEAVKVSESPEKWIGRYFHKSNIQYLNICPNLADMNSESLTFGKERIHIKITCQTNDALPLSNIETFQHGLKKRNQKQIDHIISSILQNGFSFPFFIWKHNGNCNCLDGHGRILALMDLERRGYVIPDLPIVYIEADNEKEARRKLIEINNINGTFSKQGLLDFIKDLDIDYSELNIPGVELKDIESMFHVKYNPIFDIQQITDEDVDTAKEEVENKISNTVQNSKESREFRDLVCPKCKCEFSIKK